jgi:hypothetical protein
MMARLLFLLASPLPVLKHLPSLLLCFPGFMLFRLRRGIAEGYYVLTWSFVPANVASCTSS